MAGAFCRLTCGLPKRNHRRPERGNGEASGAEPQARFQPRTGSRLVARLHYQQTSTYDQLLHRATAEVLARTDCDDAERFADAFASRDWHCHVAPCTRRLGRCLRRAPSAIGFQKRMPPSRGRSLMADERRTIVFLSD